MDPWKEAEELEDDYGKVCSEERWAYVDYLAQQNDPTKAIWNEARYRKSLVVPST